MYFATNDCSCWYSDTLSWAHEKTQPCLTCRSHEITFRFWNIMAGASDCKSLPIDHSSARPFRFADSLLYSLTVRAIGMCLTTGSTLQSIQSQTLSLSYIALVHGGREGHVSGRPNRCVSTDYVR